MREQRLWVLRPKHDEARLLIRNEALHAIEGIGPSGIAHFQPVEEPVGIESWNVGASACGNDDWGLRLGHHAVIALDLCCLPSCHIYQYSFL